MILVGEVFSAVLKDSWRLACVAAIAGGAAAAGVLCTRRFAEEVGLTRTSKTEPTYHRLSPMRRTSTTAGSASGIVALDKAAIDAVVSQFQKELQEVRLMAAAAATAASKAAKAAEAAAESVKIRSSNSDARQSSVATPPGDGGESRALPPRPRAAGRG